MLPPTFGPVEVFGGFSVEVVEVHRAFHVSADEVPRTPNKAARGNRGLVPATRTSGANVWLELGGVGEEIFRFSSYLEHPATGVFVLLSHITTAPSSSPKQSLSRPTTSDFATVVMFEGMIQRPTSLSEACDERTCGGMWFRVVVCVLLLILPSHY